MRPSQGFLGTGERLHFSGERGNKGLKIRETWEHRLFWGTGNIENKAFVLGEQGHFLEGNRYPHSHPGRALIVAHWATGFNKHHPYNKRTSHFLWGKRWPNAIQNGIRTPKLIF